MASDRPQDTSPTGAKNSGSASMEANDLDSVSMTATEGRGIVGELVEDGLLVPSEWVADQAYMCIPCNCWLNSHEQVILHLFCKKHLRNCTRISASSVPGDARR